MKRLRNLLFIVAGLAVVVVIAIFASHRSAEAITARVQRLKYVAFQTKLPENGIVQHPHTVTIPTLVSGNLGAVYVRPGQEIYAGELLATVDNPTLETNAATARAGYQSSLAQVSQAHVDQQNQHVTYDAQVATAKSSYDEAARIYNADLQLYKNKAIPRNQLDTDRAKMEQARVAYQQALQQLRLGAVNGYGQNSVEVAQAQARQAAISQRSAQQQLAFTAIRAPFAGIVQTIATQPNDPLRPLQPGDAVQQGQQLFTIAAGDRYIVKAQVDEQDIINVRPGQEVLISGQDFPGKTIVGHVAQIAPVAIKSTDASSTARQVLTTVRLDSSPPYLKDGMTVDVDIVTRSVPHAIVVPNDAIVNKKGKKYVYVVTKGVAHERLVKTGSTNDTSTLIASGLAPGEEIVAARNPLLHDGARVKPAPSPSPLPSGS
ncbi:MAG: efflux RND transporter periplasmic adaptor subunit [Vulcanimicrobiaceae bacterium]